MPCHALPCPAMPCPALPCPALPCLALLPHLASQHHGASQASPPISPASDIPLLSRRTLGQVSANYTTAIGRAFDRLLPPLRLPAWTKLTSDERRTQQRRRVTAANDPRADANGDSSGTGGVTGSVAGGARDGDGLPGGGMLSERLVNAVSKFDLSRHAPPPDKVDHVSPKDAKQLLRDVLLADGRLRPLLRGLRQALGYESHPPWQLPPDVERLSEAIEMAVSTFWKRVLRSGELPGGTESQTFRATPDRD